MGQAIIVLNAGSSSLKFSVYAVADPKLDLIAHGQIEGLETAPRFTAKDHNGNSLADAKLPVGQDFGHPQAFSHIANWIEEHYASQYSTTGIGHRIVHGGAKFKAPTRINSEVISELEKLIPLAPLHQPHNLAAVKAVSQSHPNLPQVACFDTAFHQDRSSVSMRFAISDEFFQQGIRRWGFHGLSYESIIGSLRETEPTLAKGRVIVAHLGNGASLCAIRDGRSVDTTMGFSVLDGLPMGTRCGSLDPGVILYWLANGMTPAQIEELLYKKSGLLGISGVSNDVRELLKSSKPLATEALDYFVYRIVREIGSLTAALGGLDALIFTAGIGENSSVIRQRVCQSLGWLNVAIDSQANQNNSRRISTAGSSPVVFVIPTDEEGVIAQQTRRMLSP